MSIIRKLTRVGHSCMIVIPPKIKKHLNIKRGDYLVWAIGKKNQVILDKLTPKKHPGFFLQGE